MSCKFFAETSCLRASLVLHGGGELVNAQDKFSFDSISKNWVTRNGMVSIYKCDLGEGLEWIIQKMPRGVLWKAPNSKDLDVPPPGPWEPVVVSASGIRPMLMFG